jgi:hypothetical protein
MRTIRATGTARIDAPATAVYGIIADYHVGHPSILPGAFQNLVVEEGGVGAGTRIRFEVKIGGQLRKLRAVITEPDPGVCWWRAIPTAGARRPLQSRRSVTRSARCTS